MKFMEYPNRHYNSKENDPSYEPSSLVTECSGCMQDCTGIWGSLYDPVNALFFEGGGDCVLAFSIGIYLGARAGLAIILISCLLLLAYCLISKKRQAFPLAPFLLAGTLFYLILGEIIL